MKELCLDQRAIQLTQVRKYFIFHGIKKKKIKIIKAKVEIT